MNELERYGTVVEEKNNIFVYVINNKLYDISDINPLINKYDEYYCSDFYMTDEYLQSVCVINRKYNFKDSPDDKIITYVIKNNEFIDTTDISSLGKYNIIFDSCTFDGNINIEGTYGDVKFINCNFLYDEIYIHEPMINIDTKGKVIFEKNNFTDHLPKIEFGLKIRCKKLEFKDSTTYFRSLGDQIIDTKELLIENSIVEFEHDVDIHADKIKINGFIITHDSESRLFINHKLGEIKNLISPNILVKNKAYDICYNTSINNCSDELKLYIERQILINQLRKLEEEVLIGTEKEEEKLKIKYLSKVEKIKDNPVKKYIKKSK